MPSVNNRNEAKNMTGRRHQEVHTKYLEVSGSMHLELSRDNYNCPSRHQKVSRFSSLVSSERCLDVSRGV